MNKMNFSTPVDIPAAGFHISHDQNILLLGSCFTDHIGRKLREAGFQTLCNPMGTMYNPASMSRCVEYLTGLRPWDDAQLVERDGLWHSMAHHGSFSRADREECCANIIRSLDEARVRTAHVDVLILTLGTAWVFSRQGEVVANCHKLPASEFQHRRLKVNEVEDYLCNIDCLFPEAQVLLTVSPIRHKGDGLHGNQLSKSTLLLAADRVVNDLPNWHYFPAYEIVLDELRDYRFYAADMLHPSDVAVDYVWQRFAETYFTPATQARADQALAAARRERHRELH